MHTVTQFLMHASPLLIYCVVAVVLMLESSAVPITNNTLLLFTGALASYGRLNIWVLLIVAILGSIAGACLAYTIGARGGHAILLRIVAVFRIDVQRVDMVERWCQRSGLWMIFFSRMTPYVRPFACFPAGILHMPFMRFFVAALAGSVIWCCVLLAIGWYLGARWTFALYMMQHYMLPVLCLIILAIAVYIFIIYRLKQHLRARYQHSEQPVLMQDKKDTLHV